MNEGVNLNISKEIQEMIKEALHQLLSYQPRPAKMQSFDYKTRTATILPLTNIPSYNGEVVEAQPISDVPVFFPATDECELGLPFNTEGNKEGTEEGWLFPTQISFGNWFSNGGVTTENTLDRGIHNCIFLPNVKNSLSPNKHIDNGDDYILHYHGGEIRITKDGATILKGKTIDIFAQLQSLSSKVEELCNKTSTALNALSTATYGALPGPTSCAGDLATLKSDIDTIKSDITTITNNIKTSQGN